MTRLAIIGASEFQNPLILKAKEMGIETHVFAWQCGDVGERSADFFYPISITEHEAILDECRRIGVDGVCTIASDLANITVAYVASKLGLMANDPDCVRRSTDKHLMRACFEDCGDPSPKSLAVAEGDDLSRLALSYPAIVKPSDRSGSRGITKLAGPEGLETAVRRAQAESFARVALVEEFAEGREYSAEFISWEGEHRFLSVTEKFTSGAPRFIETGHLEPARLDREAEARVREVVSHALDSLGLRCGASHSELKIARDGTIRIIEIGSRMGGDCIGSSLVGLSTGYDFLRAVIEVALGREPERPGFERRACAATRFVFAEDDLAALEAMKACDPDMLVFETPMSPFDHEIVDSGSRFGFFIFSAQDPARMEPYLPSHEREAC